MQLTVFARTLVLAALLLTACAASPKGAALTTPRAEPGETVAANEAVPAVVWAPLDRSAFERARSEGKLVLLDGAAEWCHFCHEMDATTYANPGVRRLLAAHFITVRVDVDTRPDIEERYSSIGWPATVVFSPDGAEVGKYRGYLGADVFQSVLRALIAKQSRGASVDRPSPPPKLVTRADLTELVRFAERTLEGAWDAKEHGWGKAPKVPLGATTEWALVRGAKDATLREHALATLTAQRAIMDPVWGGIYQYSVAEDWKHPHFEKLMFFNAPAMANAAQAFALTKDRRYLADAASIRGYLEMFLRGNGGGFHPSQDADLAPREAKAGARVLGSVYYTKNDAARRALGIPRVDPHAYADATGKAIAAYATLGSITQDSQALAVAVRAASELRARYAAAGGGILHDPEAPQRILYLADQVEVAWGMLRLSEVMPAPDLHRAQALALTTTMLEQLYDAANYGFFAHTLEEGDLGGLSPRSVFATRRKPPEENFLAVRLLLHVAKQLPKEQGALFARRAIETMSAFADRETVERRGTYLGAFLLAADELLASPFLPEAL